MRRQFKDTLLKLAARDESIIVLLGDISHFLFRDFQAAFPDRFYNLGICENTIISVAAGLASQGYIPFVHTIAPFITERSYEQIKLDLCYNQYPANIATCGSSFDYAWDGATHHCYTDLAILRLLPDVEVVSPASRRELDVLLQERYNSGRTTYFRLTDNPVELDVPVTFGKGVVLRKAGSACTVMTAGPLVVNVVEACRDLDVNLVYFNTIKPLDADLVRSFQGTEILVVHDAFGLHEAICDVGGMRTTRIGLPDRFLSCYGRIDDVRREIGLDVAGIRQSVQQRVDERTACP